MDFILFSLGLIVGGSICFFWQKIISSLKSVEELAVDEVEKVEEKVLTIEEKAKKVEEYIEGSI